MDLARARLAGGGVRHARLPRALGALLLVAALAFLARAVRHDAPALLPLLGAARPWPTILALAATLAASLLIVALWRGLLGRLGLALPATEAFAVLSLSYLSRYVPGGIWSFAAIGYLGRRRGIPYRAGGYSLLLTLAVQGLTALAWAVPVAVGAFRPTLGGRWWPGVALAVGALALLTLPASRRLAGALGLAAPTATAGGLAHGAALAALGLAYWALSGVATALLLRALGAPLPPVPTLIGVVALAWLGGLLGAVAPAGLGVQDAALVLLLGTLVAPEVALTVALGSRALKTINDLTLGLLGLVVYRRRGLGGEGGLGHDG